MLDDQGMIVESTQMLLQIVESCGQMGIDRELGLLTPFAQRIVLTFTDDPKAAQVSAQTHHRLPIIKYIVGIQQPILPAWSADGVPASSGNCPVLKRIICIASPPLCLAMMCDEGMQRRAPPAARRYQGYRNPLAR
jgi:hypothetical protein